MEHGNNHHHKHSESAAAPEAPGRYNTVPEGYSGTVSNCPMHTQVRLTEAGSCPICGMGLEPETVSPEEEDQSGG